MAPVCRPWTEQDLREAIARTRRSYTPAAGAFEEGVILMTLVGSRTASADIATLGDRSGLGFTRTYHALERLIGAGLVTYQEADRHYALVSEPAARKLTMHVRGRPWLEILVPATTADPPAPQATREGFRATAFRLRPFWRRAPDPSARSHSFGTTSSGAGR